MINTENMKLIKGDNIKILPELINNGVIVDCIITSPPYDTLRDYEHSLEWNFTIFQELSKHLYNILKEGGVLVWVVNDKTVDGSKTGTSFKQALHFKEIGFNIHDVMIYAKKNPIPQVFHNRYTDAFEYMFILSKGKPVTCNPLREKCKWSGYTPNNGYKQITTGQSTRKDKGIKVQESKIRNNIWYYGFGGTNYGHPAVFPYELAVDHILSWTNPHETVLDCFMGSGTTGVASYELNRKFIGIEKVEEYYKISENRIKEGMSQSKLI